MTALRPASGTVVGKLHFDETLSLGPLTLSGLGLKDSRCPWGARCVWEGLVVARIEVAGTVGALHRIELTLRPGVEPATKIVSGHELRLLDVKPYPREGVSPERAKVVATVEVRPLCASESQRGGPL